MTLRATVAAGTDIGHVREGNEDSFTSMDPLFAVADGMGGHAGGEVASGLALETIERLFTRGEGDLAEQVHEANRIVFERSVLDRSVAGMGTTLTAALLEGDRVRLAHVGDSRAYLIRNEQMSRITNDHSWVNEQIQSGVISAEQARSHPLRNVVTRALGGRSDLVVDVQSRRMKPGDVLLLCSDGLTTMIGDEDIARILGEAQGDVARAATALVAEANQRGGEDNITVVLLRFEE